jgi:hypothetical protein
MKNFDYNLLIEELEKELEENKDMHNSGRYKVEGIRSSQVRALVGLLVKKGILKPEDKNGIGE